MTVFYKQIHDYDTGALKAAVKEAFGSLGFSLPSGASVVLKPNLVIAAAPEEGITTHPVFTEAVILTLRELGAAQITIAEGPGIGEDAKEVFRKTGYEDLARALGVRLVCTDSLERVGVAWRFGEIALPRIFFDSDVYINLVKMKTHVQTMTTLCLKNQKGLLRPLDKKRFHFEWGLWDPVVELGKVVRPHLNLVDGILAMEGDGPTHRGSLRPAGAFLAGTDMIETEVGCLFVMGIPADKVPYLAGIDRPAKAAFSGRDPASLGFRMPDLRIGRKKKVVSYRNPWACSLCTAALSKAVKKAVRDPRYWFNFLPKFLYRAYISGFDILQGKKLDSLPHDQLRFPVCFGKCTREVAEEHGYPFVKGCPPQPEEILEVLSRSMKWR